MGGRSFPWYAWYARDFQSATRGWSVTARGGYRELLDAQWDQGGVPVEPDEMRTLIGATRAEWKEIWPRVEPKFPVESDGKRRNQRLERERKRGDRVSSVRSELGRLGAQRRWQQKDGNSHSNSHPNMPPGNGHSHSENMPSTSTSTSTSTNLNPSEPSTPVQSAGRAIPAGSPAPDRTAAIRAIIASNPSWTDAEIARFTQASVKATAADIAAIREGA